MTSGQHPGGVGSDYPDRMGPGAGPDETGTDHRGPRGEERRYRQYPAPGSAPVPATRPAHPPFGARWLPTPTRAAVAPGACRLPGSGPATRAAHHPLPDDLHHGGRRIEQPGTTVQEMRCPTAEPVDRHPMLGDLGGGRCTLHRQQSTTLPDQGETPAGQPVQWCDRPGRHDPRRAQTRLDAARGHLLGPGPQYQHRPAQTEGLHSLGEERGTASQRLDQTDRQVRAGDGQYQPGKASTSMTIAPNR